ncbi:blue light receptor [Globomyces sp. JEL0801]|nr:blue light receptor [Globomyces sp. JEL0801]
MNQDNFISHTNGNYNEPQNNQLSRHVTSVISHFTSSKDGYGRLLNEIDDFIHVVNSNGTLLFATPSSHSLIGKNLSDIVIEADLPNLLNHLANILTPNDDFIIHCRYKTKTNDSILLEVRGNFHISVDAQSSEVFVILAARRAISKSTKLLDSVLELQVENYQLKNKLTQLLIQKGMDPSTHSLLIPEAEGTEANDIPELFLNGSNDGIKLFTEQVSGKDMDARLDDKKVTCSKHINKQQKKRKGAPVDLFCLQCGTNKSPEWRTGPSGPKTLCNACGLAYYKKNRKLKNANNTAS